MWLSSLMAALKRLGHRLFLAYAHFRWRRWRRPWRYYKARWYVVVDDDKMNDEKVEVLTWFNPETALTEGVCFPLDDYDYFDYVPMEDRISYSQYMALEEEYWAKRGGRPRAEDIIERDRREFEEYWAKREAARAAENSLGLTPDRSSDSEAQSRLSPAMRQRLRSYLHQFFSAVSQR